MDHFLVGLLKEKISKEKEPKRHCFDDANFQFHMLMQTFPSYFVAYIGQKSLVVGNNDNHNI